METIGLIAAMPQESGALLRHIKDWKRSRLGSFPVYHFQLFDRNCLLVQSGMGLSRAMNAARTLLEKVSPQFLVAFGVAGAVNDDLQVGDVIVARNACLLDKSVLIHSHRLAILTEPAQQAVTHALYLSSARMVYGTAITTRGSQVTQHEFDEIENPILEMETSGIANVAAEHGIPLLALRAISDGPQTPLPFNLEEIVDEDANLKIGKMIQLVLRHPQIILQSRKLNQNVKKAAENLAIAVITALSQHTVLIKL